MDKTTVLVEFTLLNEDEDFCLNEVTSTLGLRPSEQGHKGEKIRNGLTTRKETFWGINTGECESFDVEEQMQEINKKLFPVKQNLKRIIKKFNLDVKYDIVIKIEDNRKPAILISKETISFLNEIQAVLDIHFYVMS